MLFRDIKQGYPIYVFDRKSVVMNVGKVTTTTMPHFDSKVGSNKLVVDISIDVDGKSNSYVFDDNGEVGYVGDTVISVNKESILREIERVKNQSEEALRMTEYYNEAVTKCNQLLKEYSTEYRERTESNERMTALEGKVDKLTESLTALLGKMDKERSTR